MSFASSLMLTTVICPRIHRCPGAWPQRCPIFSVEGLRTPAFLRRSYRVLKSTVTGTPAGDPPAINRAFESLALPLVSRFPALRGERAVKIQNAPESQGGIEQTRRGEI